ncbi:PREDICTED: uncharacterized protein LOC105367970 [Ceratosolen solmsi marchali]|uniref:Uncharacterized protein LOC105367970 n=1 Tax=Ceratosolen solmsi marchali TaxID=326594 RepID=A0AAJ6YVJ6_9HYME|nr:PREDICTED: uncharacterized protein LOC105367970 [Ceratosolen solmsi marchali]
MTCNKFIVGTLTCGICIILPIFASSIKPSENVDRQMKKAEETLTSIIDGLNERGSIPIYGNMISIEKVAAETRMIEDNQEVTDPLIKKIDKFLNSRKLHIKFPNDGSSADYFGRALGEKNFNFEFKELTRGASEPRTKLKRIILPLLLALKLKAIIILPIIITLIGLIGIKGLGAGVLALLLSGAVALKALLTPSLSYPARISFGKPYDYHHDFWHRSQEDLINQPYRAWTPEIGFDPQYNPYHEIP